MLTCARRALFKQAESRSCVLNYQKIEYIIFQPNISTFCLFFKWRSSIKRDYVHKPYIRAQINSTADLYNRNSKQQELT